MTKPAAAENIGPLTSPRRRWLPRFGLRTLLFLLLLAAIPLGFAAKRVHRARRQTVLVQAIRAMGGSVTYDYETRGSAQPQPSPWASRLPFLGVDFFHELIEIESMPWRVQSSGGIFTNPGETPAAVLQREVPQGLPDDALCQLLRGLTSLKSLKLDMQATTRASLEAISTLDGLEVLHLVRLNRHHDVATLGSPAGLRSIWFVQPDLSGSALARLPKQPKLQALHVHTAFKQNGICKSLARHPKLEVIDLSQTDVDEHGLRQLAACRSLHYLRLRQTLVTGAAFGMQDKWRRLCELDVGMCRVGDDTLPFVAGLPALRSLKVDRNQIKRDGIGRASWSHALRMIELSSDSMPLGDEQLRPFVDLPRLSSLVINGKEHKPQLTLLRGRLEAQSVNCSTTASGDQRAKINGSDEHL